MKIMSVDIEDLARVSAGDGFNLAAKVTFTVRDSARPERPLRLRAEVDVPIGDQASLRELERAILERALEVIGAVSGLAPDAAERLYGAFLASLRQ